MNWQDNAARIDGIVEAVEAKVAAILGIDPDDVIEEQESGEVPASRGYVSCEAGGIQPMGPCNYMVPLVFTIGFQMPDDGRKKRVQRLEWAMKLVQVLTASDAFDSFKLLLPADFAVSAGGSSQPHDYVWGGMTLQGSTQIARG